MKQPDFLDTDTQMDIAKYHLQTAKEDLETAKLTFSSEQYHAANNKAYYSIFYSICAVLEKNGIAFKRHKDTIRYFNKNYIHTDIFSKELGKKIVVVEKIRHTSNYNTFYIS